MQPEPPAEEMLRARLAAAGLTVGEAQLQALLPAYTGALAGARRIAALDLGETEPAMTFRHPRPREERS